MPVGAQHIDALAPRVPPLLVRVGRVMRRRRAARPEAAVASVASAEPAANGCSGRPSPWPCSRRPDKDARYPGSEVGHADADREWVVLPPRRCPRGGRGSRPRTGRRSRPRWSRRSCRRGGKAGVPRVGIATYAFPTRRALLTATAAPSGRRRPRKKARPMAPKPSVPITPAATIKPTLAMGRRLVGRQAQRQSPGAGPGAVTQAGSCWVLRTRRSPLAVWVHLASNRRRTVEQHLAGPP